MRYLIAIKGCHRDRSLGHFEVMRQTWVKDVSGADVRFFVGRGSSEGLSSDEVPLNCGDAYLDLPSKTREITRYSLANDYDFTFLCDVDTYVVPNRLLASGFEAYDLVGLFNGPIGDPKGTEGRWAWVSGGVGYWLSRRAAELVAAHEPDDWAEDKMVGQILGSRFANGELKARSDMRYGFHFDGEMYRTDVSSHYCTIGAKRKYDPQWMRNRYNFNIKGTLR